MGLLFSKDKYFAEYKIHDDDGDVRYNFHGHIPQMEIFNGYVQERRIEQSRQGSGIRYTVYKERFMKYIGGC